MHRIDLRVGNAQATAAMPEHRVAFMQASGAVLHGIERQVGCVGHLLHFSFGVRQELMQRWIEQADSHRQPVHNGEQVNEILTLHRQ